VVYLVGSANSKSKHDKKKKVNDSVQLAPRLSHPIFYERAHCLLRTLCPRNKRQHLRVSLFCVTYPSRARARQHGKCMRSPSSHIEVTSTIFSVSRGKIAGSPFFKLLYMLSESKMPGERRIKNMCESKGLYAKSTNTAEDLTRCYR
jgi:hypothetical protein